MNMMTKALIILVFAAVCLFTYYEQQQAQAAQAAVLASHDQLSALQDQIASERQKQAELHVREVTKNDQIASLEKDISLDEITLSNEKAARLRDETALRAIKTGISANGSMVSKGPTPEQLAARTNEVGMVYDTINFKDGTSLKGAKVARVDPASVAFATDSGIRTVSFDDLPDSMVAKLGLSQAEAEAWRKTEQERQAQVTAQQQATQAEENGAANNK